MEGGAYDEREAEEPKSPGDRCCGVRGVCRAGVWLVSAYTAETPLGDRQAEVEQQVQQDLAQMRGTTFFWDVNQIAEIQPEQIVYAMDMGSGDLTDYITVERTDNGDRVLTITEGDKKNTLVYQKNGKVYLDGTRMKAMENWLVSLF